VRIEDFFGGFAGGGGFVGRLKDKPED